MHLLANYMMGRKAERRKGKRIELKWDKTADTAIKQIKERRYTGKLAGYGGEILLVGISYNKESPDSPQPDRPQRGVGKKHECEIEKIQQLD